MLRRMSSLILLCIASWNASAQVKGAPGVVTLVVGAPHPGAIVYGPADMLCDLEKCRMLKVPGQPDRAEVDFLLPNLKGEERADLRRCFSFCRASVLGYVAQDADAPLDPRNPSFTIIPVELRLQ